MIKSILLIWLLSNFISSFPDQEIDFNPRLLQKEVTSIFGEKAYQMTELPIGNGSVKDSQVNGKFFSFKIGGDETIIVYVGRVNSCRSGGCSNQSDPGIDLQYEYFDYFIIFDALKKVRVVRVFNYEATHGQEVTIKKWLDQFAGYDGNEPLRVGREIDSISGATISVSEIVADIKEKTILLNNYN